MEFATREMDSNLNTYSLVMKTMPHFLLTISLICLFASGIFAQQLPIFNQYREYYGYINPASINMDFFAAVDREAFHSYGASHRRQWIGNTNFSSNTSMARGESFFELGPSVGITAGGFLMNDNIGATSFTGIYGRGSVYVGNLQGSFFGIGFTGGAVNHTLDLNDLYVVDQDDQIISYERLSSISPDLGVGIFGVLDLDRTGDMLLYGGASIPQVLGLRISFDRFEQYDYDQLRHYYAHLGFYKETSYRDYSFIEFSVWGKYIANLQPHLDFNFRYQIIRQFWFGAGYSTAKAIIAETGTNFAIGDSRYLKIGYGFSTPFGVRYGQYTGSTHEVNLSIIIEK